ncbi:Btbd6 protein [Aphelenchoides avenae]|nr:Btbd6 protein [Aphelenchus avenae]
MSVSPLYLKDDAADVHFIVPDSNGKTNCRIPAHTQVLIAQSGPFYAMFYGNFQKPPEVEIPDAKSDDFKAFLMYLYCDKVELTDDNVFPVLYLAKKYLVQGLIDKCTDHVERLDLNPTNVTHLIVQALRCGDIPERLWLALDGYAKDAMESEDFLMLDRPLLRSILQRDTLRVTETTVYNWLKTGTDSPINDARVREYLGDDLWLVRFPQMTVDEFAQGPAKDECLSDKEKLDIVLYIGSERMRDSLKQRFPLLNTVPRAPLRDIPGVRIKTLIAGDGRSFPKPGQLIRYMVHWGNNKQKEQTSRNSLRGFDLAFKAMSVGEKAAVTVSRELLYDNYGTFHAEDGEESRTVVLTVLGFE